VITKLLDFSEAQEVTKILADITSWQMGSRVHLHICLTTYQILFGIQPF